MSEVDNKRLFPGLLLIVLGGVFLLDNLDIIPNGITRHIFSWPGWMIMIGSVFLITRPNRPVGLILITIGLFFLVPRILHIPYDVRSYWPVILIVLGFVYILRQRRDPAGSPQLKDDETADFINDTTVFGGGEVVVTSDNFQGGKLTYIFGGSTINLMRAKLAPGRNVIDMFAMFGGCNFIVPSDWNVRVDVTPIFGGFSDSRKPTVDTVIDQKKELIIKGTVIFGGGELKSF